jgi:hypothetical protein
VCDLPGMPDHVLENGERASFVVRRLRPKTEQDSAPHPIAWTDDWQEYAFHNREQAWQPAVAATLQPGEERLPLFPMNYIAADGRRRRLLAGMLPVARRDAYLAATITPLANQDPPYTIDPRLAILRNDFVQPYWSSREVKVRSDNAPTAVSVITDELMPDDVIERLQGDANDQIQVISWYALLDLSSYLAANLPYVRQEIGVPDPVPFPEEQPADLPTRALTLEEQLLYDQMNIVSIGTRTLVQALNEIELYRAKLEGATQTYTNQDTANTPRADSWPPNTFNFPLTDPGLAALFTALPDGRTPLEDLVKAALPALPIRSADPPPAAQPPPSAGDPAYFIVRCVYEKPNCGPMHPPTLSAPTLAFEPASFFDPEAPARPIRIMLPIDSTPGGLRKYTKSVALMLSDQLACQKARLDGVTFGDLVLSVLPWPFHKDLPVDSTSCGAGNSSGIGLICSLSIPIITICALLLLIIIVNLLDIIFRWVPFFILCFPLPNFRGKKP